MQSWRRDFSNNGFKRGSWTHFHRPHFSLTEKFSVRLEPEHLQIWDEPLKSGAIRNEYVQVSVIFSAVLTVGLVDICTSLMSTVLMLHWWSSGELFSVSTMPKMICIYVAVKYKMCWSTLSSLCSLLKNPLNLFDYWNTLQYPTWWGGFSQEEVMEDLLTAIKMHLQRLLKKVLWYQAWCGRPPWSFSSLRWLLADDFGAISLQQHFILTAEMLNGLW